ncbi:MAG: HAD-IB family hydrolase [Clostridia bacterium]|jgi:HAD superfamily hydrolase (TIGR01490 family)|nr:HAD-IB family hydrolase [Clostridia bacterium]
MDKLAIFDFDGTLFTKDTLPYISKVWKAQTANTFRYYLIYLQIAPALILYKLKLISRRTMKVWAVSKFHKIFTNMSEEEIHKLFYGVYLLIKPDFNPQIIKEIKAAQSQGYHTVLLSGCYTELLKIIAHYLKIDTVLGMDLPIKDGKFDSTVPIPFIDGNAKQKLLEKTFGKENINWQISRSYADSINDLPVLMPVGQPIVVNPEPQLLKFARANHWQIIMEE